MRVLISVLVFLVADLSAAQKHECPTHSVVNFSGQWLGELTHHSLDENEENESMEIVSKVDILDCFTYQVTTSVGKLMSESFTAVSNKDGYSFTVSDDQTQKILGNSYMLSDSLMSSQLYEWVPNTRCDELISLTSSESQKTFYRTINCFDQNQLVLKLSSVQTKK